MEELFDFDIIWYDLDVEKARDSVRAASEENAIAKAYEKYGGAANAPARFVSATKKVA